MRTKNHIKVKGAKDSSLRGIGKLGWTESGKTIGTQRKLSATFDSDRRILSIKTNKHQIVCPVCKQKFNVNNPERIPNHVRIFWYTTKSEICKGSWSQQLSENKETLYKNEISSGLGLLKIGDRVLIDFSRTMLQEYDSSHKDLFESTLIKIEIINNLKNDGSIYSWKELLYFADVEKPIPNSFHILKHMLKI